MDSISLSSSKRSGLYVRPTFNGHLSVGLAVQTTEILRSLHNTTIRQCQVNNCQLVGDSLASYFPHVSLALWKTTPSSFPSITNIPLRFTATLTLTCIGEHGTVSSVESKQPTF